MGLGKVRDGSEPGVGMGPQAIPVTFWWRI